jgi:hypothetical protein
MVVAVSPGPVRVPSTYYQRDWFLACQDARSYFSTPVAWHLAGQLDEGALIRALEHLTLRHEALRTAFRARGDEVDQHVWPSVEVVLRPVDLSASASPAAAATEVILAEAERPRLLENAPLWHGLLMKLGRDDHVLALFIHHLVFDGWSHGVLHDELTRCYRAAVSGRPPRLPELRVQAGDFAQWERQLRDPAAEAWWRDRLATLPPLAPMPPVTGRFVACPIPAVPASAAKAVAGLARSQGAGPGAAFLAVLLAARRHLLGDDVVIGVTRARREHPDLQRVIGPLLDHLPVRVDMSGRPTFGELLHRVHRSYRDATEHQLPLGLIRQVVPVDLKPRGGRLHDTRFNYLPAAAGGPSALPDGGLSFTGWPVETTKLAPPHTEDHPEILPLSYNLRHQRDGGLTGDVCVHDSLYAPGDTAGLAEEFAAMVVQIAGGGLGQPLPAAAGFR